MICQMIDKVFSPSSLKILLYRLWNDNGFSCLYLSRACFYLLEESFFWQVTNVNPLNSILEDLRVCMWERGVGGGCVQK